MPTLFRQAPSIKINYEPALVSSLAHRLANREIPAKMSAEALNDEAPHILVVDDDDRIRSLLQRYLSDYGLRVTTARNAQTARRFMDTLAFDLLIIDIMMPGEDGISLTRSIRAHSDIPILMLTAKAETEERIAGLEIGADEYITKPFEPRELLLRTNNILKRAGPPSSAVIELVRFGPFTYNLEKGELRRSDEVIRLTEREQEMMRIFCEAAGECVPRNELLAEPSSTGERTVDVQINRLRRKIEFDPANPTYLHTVRGIGYRLIVDV